MPGPDLDLQLPGFEAVREAIDDIATKKAAIDGAAPGTQNRDYTAARNKITKRTFDRDRSTAGPVPLTRRARLGAPLMS